MSNLSDQYQNIVDATTIVSKTDLSGNITYVNSKFLEISGYSEAELIGQPHNIVRDPAIPSSVFKEIWSTIKAKKSWSGVVSNLAKDGSIYTVDAFIFPVLDKNNEIVEYISIRHDITEMTELHKKISSQNRYDTEQQIVAKRKLDLGIINDCNNENSKVIYSASDILSGDFYSLFKRADGSIFIYIIDGQGHGLSPALTVFAVSSMINQVIYSTSTLDKIVNKLYPIAKTFLGDEEQLSYTMILISTNRKNLSYCSGGVYPFLIKNGEEITKVKSNNTPFMNFSDTPNVEQIDLDKWDSIMLYSDGLVEEQEIDLSDFTPEKLMRNPTLIDEANKIIESQQLEDDITLIYLEDQAN
ncbi:MAG: SpoIIE family protein phosphatase [Helicobacteraceae bacterium]|nr:SpoIIE family protein phosphatase [Helicobacteraceae bacterium]